MHDLIPTFSPSNGHQSPWNYTWSFKAVLMTSWWKDLLNFGEIKKLCPLVEHKLLFFFFPNSSWLGSLVKIGIVVGHKRPIIPYPIILGPQVLQWKGNQWGWDYQERSKAPSIISGWKDFLSGWNSELLCQKNTHFCKCYLQMLYKTIFIIYGIILLFVWAII